MNREFKRVRAILAANVRATRKELAMSQEELAFVAEAVSRIQLKVKPVVMGIMRPS